MPEEKEKDPIDEMLEEAFIQNLGVTSATEYRKGFAKLIAHLLKENRQMKQALVELTNVVNRLVNFS